MNNQTHKNPEVCEFILNLRARRTISENSMLDILYANTTPDFHTHKQLLVDCRPPIKSSDQSEPTEREAVESEAEFSRQMCNNCAQELKKWRRRRQNLKNSARFKRSLKSGIECLETKRNRLYQTNIRLKSENLALKRQREILRQKLRS